MKEKNDVPSPVELKGATMLTVKEFSKKYRISAQTIYKWVDNEPAILAYKSMPINSSRIPAPQILSFKLIKRLGVIRILDFASHVDQFYTVKDMCQILKVHHSTLRKKIENGELAYYRIGKCIRLLFPEFHVK